MGVFDIYKGLWVTIFGPRSVGSPASENALVINDDGSVNVTISATGAAAVDGSGTIAVGGTAQALFGGTTPINGFGIYNPDATNDLWIALFTTALANGQGSIRVPASGGWYETPSDMKPSNAVSVVGANTNQKFSAYRW